MDASTCSECHATFPDGARFCMSCGAPMLLRGEGERRIATVLFADLVGSTELAVSVDPEDLRAQLSAFYESCRLVIEEFGGRLEKFIGDAVMAVFGVPRAFGDDADRAVAAGLRLVDTVALPIRVGINTGEVVATTTDRSGSLAVAGEAVHAAARLQSAAAQGQVLMGERTAQALRSMSARAMGTVTVKGFSAPVPVWAAVAESVDASDTSPYVGREHETALLERTHDRSRHCSAVHVAIVIGDPGSGKTRLAREYVRSAGFADPRERIAYLPSSPIHEAGAAGGLARLAAVLLDDVGTLAVGLEDAVARRLAGLGDTHAADVARWVGVSTGAVPIDPGMGPVDEQVLSAWVRLIRAVARESPLSIVVDDAQWADPTLLQVLERTLAAASDLPMLVVLVGRPELDPLVEGCLLATRHLLRFELPPLPDADALALLRHLLPSAREDAVTDAVRRAGGNPFFLTELARAFSSATDGGGSRTLPDTVQASIAARLDGLSPKARRFLQRGSVLGQSFSISAVAALDADADRELIDLLRQHDLVVSEEGPGERYRFRHAVIRDVVYGQLTRTSRAELHERAAGHLQATGDRADAEAAAEQMLRAAELAPTEDRARRAAGLLGVAAELASRRGSGERAQQLLESAARVAPDPATRVACLKSAAWVAWGRWRVDEALDLFGRVADAAAEAGDSAMECEASASAIEVARRFGGGVRHEVSNADTAAWAARAQRCLPVGDRRLAAYVQCVLCWQDVRSGPLSDEQVAEAVALARACGDARILSFALDTSTAHEWSMGRLEAAAVVAAQRWPIVELIRDPLEITIERSDALLMVADTALYVGDLSAFRAAAAAGAAAEVGGDGVSGRSRQLLADFLAGEWGELPSQMEALKEHWVAAGRPSNSNVAPAAQAMAVLCLLRADSLGAQASLRLVDQVAPVGSEVCRVWGDVLMCDADLHLGRVEAALDRISGSGPITNAELTPLFAAIRAEVAATAATPDAADVLAETAELVRPNRLSMAAWKRAQGIHTTDRDLLEEARAEFRSLGATYQAARTGWLIGGAAGADAAQVFARLGVPPPAVLARR